MTSSHGEVVRVAELFGNIARSLAAHEDLDTTLHKIVELAVESLDACEFAGISIVRGRHIDSSAASDNAAKVVDLIQSEVGEGPCLDAITEREVFHTGDLPAEARWPHFSARAHAETGIRSVLSVRLYVEKDNLGALNLYSTLADAFDETDIALASVFAAHAAVAMSAAKREQDLARMAASRDLIGQAKGILMAQSNIDEAAAFDLLRLASQRLNIKLAEVADAIAHPTPAENDSRRSERA